MRIIFMGTPDFAKSVLSGLYDKREENGYDIAAVITQPDKPAGRKQHLKACPVKELAIEKGLPVFSPETLRDEAAVKLLSDFGADMFCVVAYGKLLPENILAIPRLGCVNVHGSLLPEYRGAAPIQRSIMDGKTKTGITTMYMAKGLDTGDMLLTGEVEIKSDDNYGTLCDRLSTLGTDLLIDTIKGIENGVLKGRPQDSDRATYAAKIEKSELALDFSQSAKALHDKIRAVYPSLCAYAMLHTDKKETMVKFTKTFVLENDSVNENYGNVCSVDAKKNEIHILCKKGTLILCSLIPKDKGKMSAGDFIRGRQIDSGDKFI